jgi:GT2 family glycosyltransferase
MFAAATGSATSGKIQVSRRDTDISAQDRAHGAVGVLITTSTATAHPAIRGLQLRLAQLISIGGAIQGYEPNVDMRSHPAIVASGWAIVADLCRFRSDKKVGLFSAGRGLQWPPMGEPPPEVAVIIAAYNAEATLPAALASVATQSSRPSSVVVVDDGSGDGTARAVDRWKDRLPVRLVSHRENAGPGRARRSGIEATDEPLIALLDSDDAWLPDHLGLMLEAYAKRPGLITADALCWMPGRGLDRTPYRGRCPVPTPEHQRTAILASNFVFIGALFSREAYLGVGGFRDGIRAAEDWDLWIRMLRAGEVVGTTPHPTVFYRLHRRGLSWVKRQLENERQVLEIALTEVAAEDERRAAQRALRGVRTRLELVHAYEHARGDHVSAARRSAVAALRGPRPVALRALAMVVAPRAGVRLRDRESWEPSVGLGD